MTLSTKLISLIMALLFSTLLLAQVSNSEYADDEDDDSSYQETDLPAVNLRSVENFDTLLAQARREGKIILLEMSATDCGYCRTLEAEIIRPMLRSGDYDATVLIRRLHIDDYSTLKDFNGKPSSAAEIARKMNIFVTPTLVFLDGNGNEVSKRIFGINTLEMFGGYVDAALEEGLQTIGKHLRQ